MRMMEPIRNRTGSFGKGYINGKFLAGVRGTELTFELHKFDLFTEIKFNEFSQVSCFTELSLEILRDEFDCRQHSLTKCPAYILSLL